jgi:hypothetical protein
MKKLHLFLFIAVLSCLAMGCRKSVEVSFGVESLNLAAEGGTYTVELKSNGDWSLGATEGWLTVTPASGNGDATLTIEAQPNTTNQPRSIEVKATTKDNMASLTIVQEGTAAYITINPNSMLGDWEGGLFQVIVGSNMAWKVMTLPEWMDCATMEGNGDDTLRMSMHPFVEVGHREAEITIGDNNTFAKLHVKQSGTSGEHFLRVAPEVFQIPYTGDSRTMVVTCDEGWVALLEEEWASLNMTEGEGYGSIVLTVAENPLYVPRQTVIKFVSDSQIIVAVHVNQEAAPDPHFLEVSPAAFNFGHEGGSQAVYIACDMDWNVELSDEWLSLSTTEGTGNGSVTITAAPNIFNESRQATLSIVSGHLSRMVMVTQEPGEVSFEASVTPDTVFVPNVGGVRMFNITSNTDWILSVPSWITILDTSGSGDATVEMMVGNNSAYSSRIGYIPVLRNGVELARVVVVQEGVPTILSADVEEIIFTREGGAQYFNLTSNMSWTIINTAEWLYCEPAEGTNNAEILVKAAPMTGTQERETVLVIRGMTGQVINVIVRQTTN